MIYITGDTHGPERIGYFGCDGYAPRLSTKAFPEQKEMTRDDFVIICGDFGGIWNYDSRYDDTKSAFSDVIGLDHGESPKEKYWLDWLEKKPFTVLFCDGNHENFDRLEKAYPVMEFHGGMAHRIRENVFHLMRGYVFDIDGKNIFVFGGASSHDISDGILKPYEYPDERAFKKDCARISGLQVRVDHVSWWERELPSREEMDRGMENLSKHGNKVDFIVSHCAPSQVAAAAGFPDRDRLTRYLDTVAETTEFSRWFFGHYHDNRQIFLKWIMLYDQIVRVS